MASEKKVILVVEDDKLIRGALKERLNLDGFRIVEAADGMQGYEVAIKEKPNLILLDLMMPHVDGQSMLRLLRKDEWGATVPVIILSNLDKPEPIFDTMSQGAIHYLLKSDTSTPALLKTVHQVLDANE